MDKAGQNKECSRGTRKVREISKKVVRAYNEKRMGTCLQKSDVHVCTREEKKHQGQFARERER